MLLLSFVASESTDSKMQDEIRKRNNDLQCAREAISNLQGIVRELKESNDHFQRELSNKTQERDKLQTEVKVAFDQLKQRADMTLECYDQKTTIQVSRLLPFRRKRTTCTRPSPKTSCR